MTLQDFIATLPPKLAFHAGEVATAYSCRAFFRNRAKEAKAELAETIASRNGFSDPYFEDVRTAAFGQARSIKISMEKFYNKMKHQFIDSGGTQDQLDTLVKILEIQAAVTNS